MKVLPTIGLEKWSSASPRSMVRSELCVLVPENSSGLASTQGNTEWSNPFKQAHHGLLSALSHACYVHMTVVTGDKTLTWTPTKGSEER